MGVFNYGRIKKYMDPEYKTAVETGTFTGLGTKKLISHFEKIYTIELNKELYESAVELYFENKSVICLHGDSSGVLIEMMDELNKRGKTLFWLDAHWSGDESVDWKHSKWKGYGINTSHVGSEPLNIYQCPLELELMSIYKYFKHECVIYIDDYDNINHETGIGHKDKAFIGEDWSHINFPKILENIKSRLEETVYTGTEKQIEAGKPHQLLLKMRDLNDKENTI